MVVTISRAKRTRVQSPFRSPWGRQRLVQRGGEVSDRQWRDVTAIVRAQGNRLDRTYLQSAVRLNVVDLLLARAIADDKA
jgi:hypothetical protein